MKVSKNQIISGIMSNTIQKAEALQAQISQQTTANGINSTNITAMNYIRQQTTAKPEEQYESK